MEKRPVQISEKTLMPIGFVIVILGVALRVQSISSKANANEEKIAKLEKTTEEYQEIITEVRLSLVAIKTHMGIKDEIQNKTGR